MPRVVRLLDLPPVVPTDPIAFGRHLVPHGFSSLPVRAPAGAFVWKGYDHALVAGAWRPFRRAWEPGPPTEPMTPLRPAERFSPLARGMTATERFTP